MRELHCACGNRLVAENDEDLVQQVLNHAHEVHPEMDLGEGQAREMVTSQASETEDASRYSTSTALVPGWGPSILCRGLRPSHTRRKRFLI